ncbi:MAG: MFS transporter [Hyphomicrobiaceae bacterium]
MTEQSNCDSGVPKSMIGTAETRWSVVWIAFGAGVVASMQIGKLPPSMLLVKAEFEAGFVAAGWIASMISTTGFILGLVSGSIVDHLGHRKVLIFGLCALALGSLLGALAPSIEFMLLARFIEGVGFASTTVAGGAMIARESSDQDRKWALGVWAAYMPVGFAGMMMITAALLDQIGWRAIWVANTAIATIWVSIVLAGTTKTNLVGRGNNIKTSLVHNIGVVLSQRGALLVAATYALYAAQHIGMMTWLPTLMQETYSAPALLAAAVTAAVLIFNGLGNYVAAWSMARDIPIWILLTVGCIVMALMEAAVFLSPIPDSLRILCILFFGIAGGLVPASALAAVPTLAPSPAFIGLVGGLMVMATNTGQLFGAPILAWARVFTGSWEGTAYVLIGMATVATLCALTSRTSESCKLT